MHLGGNRRWVPLTAVKELLTIFIHVNFNKADTISLVASNRSPWSLLWRGA